MPRNLSSIEEHRADDLARRWFWLAVLVGIGGGCVLYARGPRLAGTLARIPPVSWVHTWLRHRMYFDELYDALFVQPVFGLAGAVAAFDAKWGESLAALARRLTGRSGRRGRRGAAAERPPAVEHRSGQPS